MRTTTAVDEPLNKPNQAVRDLLGACCLGVGLGALIVNHLFHSLFVFLFAGHLGTLDEFGRILTIYTYTLGSAAKAQ
ncbi:MAG: hypothetical protein JO062_18900 [Bryobacterales bacterium]|nr:hypothetical protein [Bryobacterales bacterium]